MTISVTIRDYLTEHKVPYDTLSHALTATSSQTAEVAHIPGARLIKSVVIKCNDEYMLALLPASHHINRDMLKDTLWSDVELAKEEEFTPLFTDCVLGAVPALGMAYNLKMVIDNALADVGDVMFEGGDHQTLVRMPAEEFREMTSNAIHGNFAKYDKHPEKRGGFRFTHC